MTAPVAGYLTVVSVRLALHNIEVVDSIILFQHFVFNILFSCRDKSAMLLRIVTFTLITEH
jgi:hypothetical protein